MAKLTRAIQKIFCGGIPPINAVAVFGSLKAGAPAFSDNPDDIQSLPAYDAGWSGATVLNQAPALQDMNALQFLFSRQLKYLFQQGIPEWSATETYYTGSIVTNSTGLPYVSLINDNLNQALTNTDKWKILTLPDLKWNSQVKYSIGDVVTGELNKFYFSVVNDNLNFPLTDTTKWQALNTSIVWSATALYELGAIVQSNDGQLYVSLVANNLNNSLTDPTKWELLVSRASITGVSTGSTTLNCQLNSTFSKSGTASAINIGLNNMAEGQTVTVLISTIASQGAITWKRGTDSAGTTDIRWSNQVIPTPTVTAGRHDRYIFQKINGIIFGSADMNCY